MTPFEVLGLSPSASDTEIKQAYRRLAMKYHPDRDGGDHEKFYAVKKAYVALSARTCPLCEGSGRIKERSGAFVKTVNCPKCWAKD